jgi:hypothetical protein
MSTQTWRAMALSGVLSVVLAWGTVAPAQAFFSRDNWLTLSTTNGSVSQNPLLTQTLLVGGGGGVISNTSNTLVGPPFTGTVQQLTNGTNGINGVVLIPDRNGTPNVVPEPSSLLLIASGFVAMGAYRRRVRSAQQ